MGSGNFKRVLIIAATVLLLGGIGAFLGRHIILDRVNSVRADRLGKQAAEAFEQELWEKAGRLGTAAYYLDPTDQDNQLLVARALLKQKASGAVGWWKRVLGHPDIDPEELRTVTTILINTRRLDDGMLFLNRLVELDPDSTETKLLWLQSLDIQKRLAGIMDLSEKLVSEGTDDWAIHRQYLAMQQAMKGDAGEETVKSHLKELIERESAISLVAARELASYRSATEADRLMAASYLLENAEDDLDRLYAFSIKLREEGRGAEALEELLDKIFERGDVDELTGLLNWSRWMNRSKEVLDRLDWEEYREKGGQVEPYFEALLAAGEYRDLVDISEQTFSDSGEDGPLFLYYRAKAWRNIGDSAQAKETLDIAVQVADPGNTTALERKLFQDQQWELLIQLYRRLLDNEPDNLLFAQKFLAANYYLGNQDALEVDLKSLDLSRFEGLPAVQGFVLYLRVLLLGALEEDHQRLENLLAEYPEIFDFRLILGVSYLLRDEREVARGFLEGMPELGSRAPRFLRVCALLLGEDSNSELIPPSEYEYLLPRERYLLSQYSAGLESTD